MLNGSLSCFSCDICIYWFRLCLDSKIIIGISKVIICFEFEVCFSFFCEKKMEV